MATATNSRLFGVIHGTEVHPGQPGYTSAGVSSRLYVADSQAQSFYPTLANTQWVNGIDESRFTWYIAYLVMDNEGNPQLNTKIGTQTSAPPQNPAAAVGEEIDAYVRFKGGSDNDEFIAALKHIKEQNEAAGNVLNNGAMPNSGSTADEWKSWADSNLDYYTNIVIVTTTTTTTTAPSYFYATVANCADNWNGVVRSTQRLLNNSVYNLDENNPYPAETEGKAVVINNNVGSQAHDADVVDFNATTCESE